MKKSLTCWTICTAVCCLALATVGCGFFGSKKQEVAQATDQSEPKQSAPSKKSSSPSGDSAPRQESSSPKESQPQQRGPTLAAFGGNTGGSGGGQSHQHGQAASRGPTIMSADEDSPGKSSSSGGKDKNAAADGHNHSHGEADSRGPVGAGGQGPAGGPGGGPGGPGGGLDMSGQGGPPKGFGEENGGYGGEDVSGQGGPPKGFGEENGGYGGEDVSGQGGPPAGVGDENPYGQGGFDPSGGASAPGMEEEGGYPGEGGPGGPAGLGAGQGPGGPAPGNAGPGSGNSKQEAEAKPRSQGLMGQAEQAMAEGREGAAFQYLYALALSDDESDLFNKYGWVGGLRRPTLAVRWAIGVNIKISPRSYNGSIYPIGSTQNLPARNSRRGRGGGGGFPGADGGGFPGAGGPGGGFPGADMGAGMGMGGGGTGARGGGKKLADFAGELGSGTIEVLVERVDSGSFGDILTQLSPFVNAQSAGTAGGGASAGLGGMGMGPGGMGGPGGPAGMGPAGLGAGGMGPGGPGGFGGPEGEGEEMEDADGGLGAPQFGGGGAPGGAAPAGGGAQGDGHDHQHGPAAAGNRGNNRGRRDTRRSPAAPGGPPQFAAGVIFLGTGSPTTLKRKAAQQGVDVLMIFDVDVVRNSRTGVVRTNTKASIVDVYKNAGVVKLKSLSNIKVQTERAKGGDPVNSWIEDLIAKIDDPANGLIMSDLPAGLKPEHAKARVERLAADYASAPGNPLPILAEIAFYYSRQLIDDDTRTRVYQQILGKLPGEQLSLGDAKERLEVLKRWMPRD